MEKICRNCKNCKEGTTEDAFWGSCYTYLCLKNNLYTNNPSNHTCDMFEQRFFEFSAPMLIRRVELYNGNLRVELVNPLKQTEIAVAIISIDCADKLIVGTKFDLNRLQKNEVYSFEL